MFCLVVGQKDEENEAFICNGLCQEMRKCAEEALCSVSLGGSIGISCKGKVIRKVKCDYMRCLMIIDTRQIGG